MKPIIHGALGSTVATIALVAEIAACGGGASAGGSGVVSPDAAPDTSVDASTPSFDASVPIDSAEEAAFVAEASDEAESSAEAGSPVPPLNLSGVTPGVWSWFQFPQTICRDGSQTGFSINLSPSGLQKVMFFLEGGGACFNDVSCAVNTYNVTTTAVSSGGVFDRTNADNPFAEYTMIHVPYCTGDIHAGNKPDASVAGETQHFVGYANAGFFLRTVASTFPDIQQLVVTGSSAGGFGAALNYGQALRIFPSIPVNLVDDSGPLMEPPALAQCLENLFANTWGFDTTVLAECGADCAGQTDWGMAISEHWLRESKYATGLISATGDEVIRTFWGFAYNECTTPVPIQESVAGYTAGLDDIRTKLAPYPNFGAYLYNSTNHTVMEGDLFYSSVDGGPSIAQWARTIIESNQVTNVGP